MAEADLIGMSATSATRPQVPPTFGARPRLGTDPFSFAAPAGRNKPFVLDMATTTVASGKIRKAALEGRQVPQGWMTDARGQPTTDARATYEKGFLTPLGGTPELSNHKGYGLAVMVNILTSCLTGASLITSPGHTTRTPGSMELAHFFQAIDPTLFRPLAEFKESVDELIDTLRATEPIDPKRPVMVHGDPEEVAKERHAREGIEVSAALAGKVKAIAAAAGAPYLLGI